MHVVVALAVHDRVGPLAAAEDVALVHHDVTDDAPPLARAHRGVADVEASALRPSPRTSREVREVARVGRVEEAEVGVEVAAA